MNRSKKGALPLMVLVFSGMGCIRADDECVLGDGSGLAAQPAANPPRALDPAARIASPEVRAYLDQRRQQMEIIATTTTRRGSVYDWIYPESQVPGGQLASPPPPDPTDPREAGDACKTTAARSELAEEPSAWGPPGTVPILRIDPDRIHAPGTVADFLSKYGDASDTAIPLLDTDAPAPQVNPADGHFHARSQSHVANHGGDGYLNVWTPFVLFPLEMSLAQIAIVAKSPAVPLQTIEAGWHVLGRRYGDFATRFFVYFTTNGYQAIGPNVGSYNQDFSGWVQVSRTITPGNIITPISVFGGEQAELYISVDLLDGNWWVKVGPENVGYYPASLFAAGGLGTEATHILFQGETFDDPTIPGMTVSDMGSGRFPSLSFWRNAAYMRNLRYQDPEGVMKAYLPAKNEVGATNEKCYAIIRNPNVSHPWGSQIYYGGQGQSAICP